MRFTRSFRLVTVFYLCLLLAGALSLTALAASRTPNQLISDATAVIKDMTKQADAPSMGNLLKLARGVAIFPRVITVGYVVGGKHGQGLVLRRGTNGQWYGPCFFEINALSIGFQAGLKSTALLLVITNDQGMNTFNGDEVTLGGQASIAAGPVGREAQAATDSQLSASIYTYSISKGLFGGLSLEGAKLDDDPTANKTFWSATWPPTTILSEKSAGNRIAPVVNALAKLMAKANK